jgi:hypothetical protein
MNERQFILSLACAIVAANYSGQGIEAVRAAA